MQMWIANRWEGAVDGRTFEVRNPATEDLLDTAPRAGAADVERAVAAAQRAFPVAAHARHRAGGQATPRSAQHPGGP